MLALATERSRLRSAMKRSHAQLSQHAGWSDLPRELLSHVCSYLGAVQELLLLGRLQRGFHSTVHNSAARAANSCWAHCGLLTVKLTADAAATATAALIAERHKQPLALISLQTEKDWAELERRLYQLRHFPACRLEFHSSADHLVSYSRWIKVSHSFLLASTGVSELALVEHTSPHQDDAIAYPPCPVLELRYLRSLDVATLQPRSFVPMVAALRSLCHSRLLRLTVSAALLAQLCLGGTELASIVWLELVALQPSDFSDWPPLPFPSLRFLSLLGCRPTIATWTSESRVEAVWTRLEHLRCRLSRPQWSLLNPPAALPAPPRMENLRSLVLDLPARSSNPCEASASAAYKRSVGTGAVALLTSMPHLEQLTIRGFTAELSVTPAVLNLLPRLTYLHLASTSFAFHEDFLYQLMQRNSPIACRPQLTHLCL
jgi:hypothetical protein